MALLNFETASALIVFFVMTKLKIVGLVPKYLVKDLLVFAPPQKDALARLVRPKHKRGTVKKEVDPVDFRMAKLGLARAKLWEVVNLPQHVYWRLFEALCTLATLALPLDVWYQSASSVLPDIATTAEYGVLLLCLVLFLSSYNLCYTLVDSTFTTDSDSERYLSYFAGMLGIGLAYVIVCVDGNAKMIGFDIDAGIAQVGNQWRYYSRILFEHGDQYLGISDHFETVIKGLLVVIGGLIPMGLCSPTMRFTKGFMIGMKDNATLMVGEGGRRKALLWADLLLPLIIALSLMEPQARALFTAFGFQNINAYLYGFINGLRGENATNSTDPSISDGTETLVTRGGLTYDGEYDIISQRLQAFQLLATYAFVSVRLTLIWWQLQCYLDTAYMVASEILSKASQDMFEKQPTILAQPFNQRAIYVVVHTVQYFSMGTWLLALNQLLHRKTNHGIMGYALGLAAAKFEPRPLVGSAGDLGFTTGLPGNVTAGYIMELPKSDRKEAIEYVLKAVMRMRVLTPLFYRSVVSFVLWMTVVWLTALNSYWLLGWCSGWFSGEVINIGNFYGDKRLIDRTTKPQGGPKPTGKEGPAKKKKLRAKQE